jgi:hypothetical protein
MLIGAKIMIDMWTLNFGRETKRQQQLKIPVTRKPCVVVCFGYRTKVKAA